MAKFEFSTGKLLSKIHINISKAQQQKVWKVYFIQRAITVLKVGPSYFQYQSQLQKSHVRNVVLM